MTALDNKSKFHNRKKIFVNYLQDNIFKTNILYNYPDIYALAKISAYDREKGGIWVPYEDAIDNDFLRYQKLKRRTKLKFSTACIVCGSIYNIEMHHIKKISKNNIKNKATFEQTMGLLNRKQVPICSCCHSLQHQGKLKSKPLIASLPKAGNFTMLG